MNIPVLMCKLGQEPERLELAAEEVADAPGPVVFVIEHGWSDSLTKRRELFRGRGLRDERKPLKHYLLRPPLKPVPILRTDYCQAGRLRSSVEGLLRQAVDGGTELVCVISIPGKLFEELAPAKDEETPEVRGQAESDYLRLFGYDPREKDLAHLILGGSLPIVIVRQKILKAAESRTAHPVLLTGPTGSGKSMAARLIHQYSPRRGKPFHEKNVAAIPAELLEEELFGHMPGVFTHGTQLKKGLWELADGGTLFLDEIGDMRLEHQAKVLHALQRGVVRPIGGERDIPVDVRIIAATNLPLEQMTRSGRFREDLYYRLSGFNIELPSLDDRPDDIPLLAQRFWSRIAGNGPALPAEVVEYLKSVHWPGGVRLLKRALEVVHSYVAPGTVPSVEQIEYVLGSFAPARPSRQGERPQTDGREASRYLSDCVLHLRRLDAVLAALRPVLSTLGQPGVLSTLKRRSLRNTVALRLGEVDELCRSPLLFHDRRLTEEALALATHLRELSACVPSRGRMDAGVGHRLEMTLRSGFERLSTLVFDTMQRIISELTSLDRPTEP